MTDTPAARLVADWSNARAAVAAADRLAHPDLTDRHGRVWVWKDGDLYTHDSLLALPADLIPDSNLPTPGLAESNPNYAGLCSVCRHEEQA